MKLLVVENVGKAFRTYRSELLRFARWFGLPFKPVAEHWVLRGVSFEIRAGEAVGIVGQNGAGKSTLLKMITGTSQPNEGKITVNGRIAAILELGMGFSPELTGRQNAAHAAGIMGFTHAEIQQLMPEIEAFAEIGEYFNEPVRTYSSGMQMRVAFAVATAKRPEILIVDEALSVGDAYFQHKCTSRIRAFREEGMTLLIVSHDKGAVQQLCSRAILLDKGQLLREGPPEAIFDYYNALIAEKENSTVQVTELNSGKIQTVSGTGEAKVKKIAMYNAAGHAAEMFFVGEQVRLSITVEVFQNIEALVLGYGIKDRFGQVMYGTNTWHTKQVIQNPVVGNHYKFDLVFPMNLGVGSYSVQTALTDSDTHLSCNYEWRDLAFIFQVVNRDKNYFEGSAWVEPVIEIKEI